MPVRTAFNSPTPGRIPLSNVFDLPTNYLSLPVSGSAIEQFPPKFDMAFDHDQTFAFSDDGHPESRG
jgi:hypothetical protein